MVIDLSWLDITQILLLLAACLACFHWGKQQGIEETVITLIDEGHIKPEDFK